MLPESTEWARHCPVTTPHAAPPSARTRSSSTRVLSPCATVRAERPEGQPLPVLSRRVARLAMCGSFLEEAGGVRSSAERAPPALVLVMGQLLVSGTVSIGVPPSPSKPWKVTVNVIVLPCASFGRSKALKSNHTLVPAPAGMA